MRSRRKRELTWTTPILILYVVDFFLSINIEKVKVRSHEAYFFFEVRGGELKKMSTMHDILFISKEQLASLLSK
jgi:hypothetical protein